MAVTLAAVGAVLLACGFGLIWFPLAPIVAGAELLAAAYIVLYLEARRAR